MPQFLYNDPEYKQRRRKLRNDPTPAEVTLWHRLRARQFHGLKFRRQQGIGAFVVDFFCYKLRLAIEIDGDSHGDHEARRYDKNRDHFIRSYGITIVRLTNNDVMRNLNGVMMYLEKYLPPRLISEYSSKQDTAASQTWSQN